MLIDGWTDVVRLPGFWVACAVIFLLNSLIALFAGFWILGALQLFTALLCAGSVAGVAQHRRHRDAVVPQGDEQPGTEPAG